MYLVIRRRKCTFHYLGEWRAKKSSAVLPTSLMNGERLHPRARERFCETCPVQYARRVGTDLNARADLRQDSRLFVNVGVDTDP